MLISADANARHRFCIHRKFLAISVEVLLILGEYGRKGRRTLLQRLQVDWLVEWWPGFGTARAWDFGSAAALWNRMAAACGHPTTLHAARAFTSLYPAKPAPPNKRCSLARRGELSTGVDACGNPTHSEGLWAV